MSTSDINLLNAPNEEIVKEIFKSSSALPPLEIAVEDPVTIEEFPRLSNESVLTRITQQASDEQINRIPICLNLWEESNSQIIENDAFCFPPNKNPHIEQYMAVTESDDYRGWERYCFECHKYSMPRISIVKDILNQKTTVFNMKV